VGKEYDKHTGLRLTQIHLKPLHVTIKDTTNIVHHNNSYNNKDKTLKTRTTQ